MIYLKIIKIDKKVSFLENYQKIEHQFFFKFYYYKKKKFFLKKQKFKNISKKNSFESIEFLKLKKNRNLNIDKFREKLNFMLV